MLATALPSQAQEPSSPLVFGETEWDFGTFMEDGGPVSHEFTFTNSGDTPIAIDRVNASCGCTTPTFTRSLIEPGGKGSVNVSFEPMGYPGEMSKSVVVVSGGSEHYDMLIIKGEVIPRVKSVEELYPVDMGGGFRVDNPLLAFRQVAQGKASSMTVGYINTSDKTVTLEVISEEESGLLLAKVPEHVCAGCKGEMTFTYDLTDKEGHYGMIHDLVRFSIDGTMSDRTIYTTMIGIDDFAAQSIEIAPKLSLNEQYHNFGEIRRRTIPYVSQFVISNSGEETLFIRSVSEKPGLKSTLRGGMSLAPGASIPFEVILYSSKYSNPGELFESIIVTSNDPLRPVREIRISANIK